jgi:hypothetical protein
MEVSSPKEFPAIAINPDAKSTNFAKNAFAAVNAALGFGKYRKLELDDHIAWVDPLVECEAVRSTFYRWTDTTGEQHGEWKFYDWKDQSFQVSVLDWDNTIKATDGDGLVAEKQRRIGKRANMVRKHHVLNQMISSKVFGSKFLAVFNNDEDLNHWKVAVKDHLEDTYEKALEAEDERWAEARERKVAKYGYSKPTNTAVQDKHPAEHKDMLSKIIAEQGLVVVRIQFSGRTAPWERTFDPSVDEAQVNALKSLPLTAKIVSYEKVA